MKKIMVCFDLNKFCFSLLGKELKKWNWSEVGEVHLVHGFAQQIYADNFFITAFPASDQISDVEASVQTVLSDFEKQVFSDHPQASELKILKKCLVANSPKEALCDYAEKNAIDTMVIGTRGVHGVRALFRSSFAEYMVRHAPCELRIIRE